VTPQEDNRDTTNAEPNRMLNLNLHLPAYEKPSLTGNVVSCRRTHNFLLYETGILPHRAVLCQYAISYHCATHTVPLFSMQEYQVILGTWQMCHFTDKYHITISLFPHAGVPGGGSGPARAPPRTAEER